MSTRVHATGARPLPLLRASHIGPGLAVTALTALLALATGLEPSYAVIVTLAVFTGQLTVGWANDLVDLQRDRQVHRADKPVAVGEVTVGLVRGCLATAVVATVVLSLAAGWRSGLVHLVAGLGSAHLYNLVLKRSVWSWLPYAVAFGTLPAVVTLAGPTPHWPASWMVATAAALGVAAHLLNALPDFADDAATGVRGLPHRLGGRNTRLLATALLVTASLVALLGPPGTPAVWAWMALGVVLVLAAVALVGHGRRPFQAAVGIALVDVVLLVAVAW